MITSQAGAVQVLFALLLAVLAGFAALSVDLGRAFVERQHLQNVADAAALAGSHYLPDQSQAASVALDVAGQNGVNPGVVQVDFPAADRIAVRVSRHLPFVLASVLGVNGTDVGAAAEVARSGVGTLSGGDPSLGAGGCRTGEDEAEGDDGDGDGHRDGHGNDGHGNDGGGDKTDRGHGDGGKSGDRGGDEGDDNGSHQGQEGGHGDGGGDGHGTHAGDGSGDGHGADEGDGSGEGGDDAGDGLPQCGRDGGQDGEDGNDGRRGHDEGDGAGEGGEDADLVNGGMAPLAVERTVLDGLLPGDWAELKVGPGGQTGGNFHALALGARGAKAYESNLRLGFPGVVRVGDVLQTEPGNMAGPTDRAVAWRLAADPGVDWQTVRPGSPRLLYVGVIDTFEYATGRDTVTLLGFAAFFLEDCGAGAAPGTVCGRFLRWVVPGQGGGGSYGFDAVQIVR